MPVVGLKLVLAGFVPGPWLFSDSTLYARQASALFRQGLAALQGPAQDYTILYPLLVAPAFALPDRGQAHQLALVVNALVSTSALFPLYWIARRMLPRGVSFVLTGFVAFLPATFVSSLALSSENLFVPLFWWGTFLLLRLAERDRAADAVAAGLVIGVLPAVKLTGFAVLAAAGVLLAGMALFHRIGARRAAIGLVALLLPQLVWVLLRALFANPDRGLFGFGPGVGEALVGYLARFDEEGWRSFLSYFVSETTYFMTGAYVAWVAFSLYLIAQYRTWRSRSAEGFLLLWTLLAAAALAAVTVLLLYPIAQSLTDPEQRAREIYGRFIEVLFPAFFILGTRGMIDFAWARSEARSSRRELSLLLLVLVLTAMSFYPLTGYAVSSDFRRFAFGWLDQRLALGVGVLVLLLLLPGLAAALWLFLRSEGDRRVALGLGLLGVLGIHALIFGVTLTGTIRGAQIRDRSLHRIGHWLDRFGEEQRVAYDAGLGMGHQYFAYRFWRDGGWEVVPTERLLETGAPYVVTGRSLPLPVVVREDNGVVLYRTGR